MKDCVCFVSGNVPSMGPSNIQYDYSGRVSLWMFMHHSLSVCSGIGFVFAYFLLKIILSRKCHL